MAEAGVAEMKGRFTIRFRSAEHSESDALAKTVGEPVRVNIDGRCVNGVILAAEVAEDGYGIAITVEVDAPMPELDPPLPLDSGLE